MTEAWKDRNFTNSPIPETIDQVVLRLRAGRLTQTAIGERLGLPQTMISEILRDAGVRGWLDPDPTGARLTRILTLYAHGCTQAHIAFEVGLCQAQVSEIRRNAGYRRHRHAPRRKQLQAA